MKTHEYITCTTETKLNSLRGKNGDARFVLSEILDDIKEQNGFMGMTLRQISRAGAEIPNRNQIAGNGWRKIGFHTFEQVLNGLSMNYPEYVNYSNSLGLDCLTIKDFNGLVNTLYNECYTV